MARVREVVDAWFGYYPTEHRKRFSQRFSSTDDEGFLSAFFELYLHELCRRLGYVGEVLDYDDSTRRPDFDMVGATDSFVLEATLITEADLLPSRVARITDSLVDELNDRIRSPNFFIDLHESGVPKSQPSARDIAAQLQKWIDSLDRDAELLAFQEHGNTAMPRKCIRHEDFRLNLTARPRNCRGSDGDGTRVIGLRMRVGMVDRVEAIHRRVKKKATRYGKLGKPYIVALNVGGDIGVDETEFDDALFSGTEVGDAGDSVWLGPQGWRNLRVSGVLTACGIRPWSIASRSVTLYENPKSSYPYSGRLAKLPRRFCGSDRFLTNAAGLHPREIFEIHEGWPK